MKKLLSLVAVMGLLSFVGCGGGDDEADPLLDYAAAINSINSGQAVQSAPSYVGGPIPHKVGQECSLQNDERLQNYGSYRLRDHHHLPTEWLAASVSELQLYIKYENTSTPTGQTQNYGIASHPVTFECRHQTDTYALVAAHTGEVLATKVLQGEWSGFPESVQIDAFSQNERQYIDDEIPDFSVVEWVRPFVERQ